MTKTTQKALDNIIMKIDELLEELAQDKELNTQEKAEIGIVYHNVFNFIKREDYEHNLAVLNNDAIKRKFNLHDLDI
jgi:hypothetical protein